MTGLTAFLDRYEDETPPTVKGAWSDFVHRAFLPALVLWLVVAGVGFLITGPLGGWPAEASVNAALQEHRTPLLDRLTYIWSASGDVPPMTAACVLIGGFIWWRTGRWWIGVLPGVALALEAFVFLTTSLLVGRGRPEVEHLDDSPPTSGYPSGHVGASVAFYLTLALLARRIRHPALRWPVIVVCLAIPVLIAYSRLYRGMHHPSDVAMGAINGLTCVVLAWGYLRRDPEAAADDDGAAPTTNARSSRSVVGPGPAGGRNT